MIAATEAATEAAPAAAAAVPAAEEKKEETPAPAGSYLCDGRKKNKS